MGTAMWDERVNAAIDEVAREMTEEAPATDGADFRRRVLARIASKDQPRASWRAAFVLSPVAVAAAIAIAVLIVRRPYPVGSGVPQPAPTVATAPTESGTPNTVRLTPDITEAAGSKGPALQEARGFRFRERSPERAAPPQADVLEPALHADSIAVAPLVVSALAPDPIAIDRIDTITPVTVAPLETIPDMQRRQE